MTAEVDEGPGSEEASASIGRSELGLSRPPWGNGPHEATEASPGLLVGGSPVGIRWIWGVGLILTVPGEARVPVRRDGHWHPLVVNDSTEYRRAASARFVDGGWQLSWPCAHNHKHQDTALRCARRDAAAREHRRHR